jgi:hypothetical protein
MDHPMPTTSVEPAADGSAAQPRPGEDAESGNTASYNCTGKGQDKESLFQVVWQGIDTLELTYPGQISARVNAELSRLKDCAQSQEARVQATAQYQIGDRFFEVADRGGRFFAYLLRHPDMRIAVASENAKRIPLASVTLQNHFLITVGPEAAEAQARDVVQSLGTLEGSELVKRCDIAADIATDQRIGAWPAEAWVTRAERIDPHYVNGQFTGWSIGLGADVSGRLYDKKLEIVKSNKPYFLELWERAGWFPADPVVRIEHQFRRKALAQFGLSSFKEVLNARPALWGYATREWTKLAVPNPGDETKSRWPLHPFWEAVQAIRWDGSTVTLERKRPSTNAPSDRVLARMFKAVATAVMARDGLATVQAAGERLTSLLMAQLQRIEQWEGAPADEMLMEAVMLKRRRYCLPVKS